MARDNVNVKINIDTKKAEKSVAEVLEEMEHLNQEIDEAKKSGDENMLAGLQSEFDVLEGSISNSTKTLGNLSNRLEYLQESIQNVEVGTDEFKRLQMEIKQTDGNLRTVEESLEGMSFNDAASMASQLAGGIGDVTGSMMLLGGASDETMAEMQESLNKGIGIMMGITGAIDIAEVASRSFKTSMKALNKVMMANPIGAIAVAAAALATATYFLVKRLKEQNAEFEVSNESIAEFNTAVITEGRELDKLYGNLKDTTVGTEERTKAVDALKRAYPDYLTDIDLEKATLEDINQAHRDSARLMRANIAEKLKDKQLAEAMEPIYKKLGKRQIEFAEDIMKGIHTYTKFENAADKSFKRWERSARKSKAFAEEFSTLYIRALQDGKTEEQALRVASKELKEEMGDLSEVFSGRNVDRPRAYGKWMKVLGYTTGTTTGKINELVSSMEEIEDAFDFQYAWVIDTGDIDLLTTGANAAKGAIGKIEAEISRLNKKITETPESELSRQLGIDLEKAEEQLAKYKEIVFGIEEEKTIVIKKSLAEKQKAQQKAYEFEVSLIEANYGAYALTEEQKAEKARELYELELNNLLDKLALLEESARAEGKLTEKQALNILFAKADIEDLKAKRKAATKEQVIGLDKAKKALKKNYEYEKDLIERTVEDKKEKNRELKKLELEWLKDKLKLANKFAKENGKLSDDEAQRIRDLRAEVKLLEDEIGGGDEPEDIICEDEIQKELSCEEKKIEKINELKIHAAHEAANAITEILGRANQRQLADEKHALDEKYNKEIDRINEMAEIGAISQEEKERQLEDAAERKEERDLEIKIKQFEYDKKMSLIQVAIQTALAVIEAAPNPFAMIAAGITGAASAATILATKPPTYALGGLVEGDEHEQGGTLVEAERGEVILNKQSMANPAYRQLASQINVAGGGVPISPATSINQNENSLLAATVDNNSLEKIVKQVVSGISQIPVTVTETDITERQRQVQVIENKVTF